MRNGEALFTGDVMITGQSVRLRQTWHRRREFSVEIKNKRYSDGYWQRWDRALLERLTQAN